MEELSDAEVIIRASEGDQEAFSVLYQRYVKRIYNYIYYRTGSVHDAEDLTEKSLLSRHESYSQLPQSRIAFFRPGCTASRTIWWRIGIVTINDEKKYHLKIMPTPFDTLENIPKVRW